MDLIVLVCVVSAALAVGVLAAYGICMAMFAAFRMHARQTGVKRPVAESVPVARTVQGWRRRGKFIRVPMVDRHARQDASAEEMHAAMQAK
jgi:hypothetical protein